jgi:hypothetical protein
MLCDVGSFVLAIRRVSEDHELCIRQEMLFKLLITAAEGIPKAIGVIRVDQCC